MSGEEALIHVDFSENYSCKYSSEVQAVHFGASHQQATLHTGVLYVGGHPESVCFSTICPNRQKGPPAIWQHLNPVLDYLQAQHPQVSVLHFLTTDPVLSTNNEATSTFSRQNCTEEDSGLVLGIFSRLVMEKQLFLAP